MPTQVFSQIQHHTHQEDEMDEKTSKHFYLIGRKHNSLHHCYSIIIHTIRHEMMKKPATGAADIPTVTK